LATAALHLPALPTSKSSSSSSLPTHNKLGRIDEARQWCRNWM